MKTSKEFFTNLHDVECNQKYNKTLPYSFHLEIVYLQGFKFKSIIMSILERDMNMAFAHKDTLPREIIDALWGHDSIEDARLTYNDIELLYGKIVAEIIYLCTDFKGKNREERKPKEYYQELSQNKLALFVKLCDLIANIKFGLLTNSTMYQKYKIEWILIKRKILGNGNLTDFKEMFIYINSLLNLET